MKISTSKSELQHALQKLSKATPSRSTLPILSFVLFKVDKKETVLRSTDLEITIVTKLPTTIEKTGQATIPLQTLLEITNELGDERITIATDDQNKVKLITDTGKYDLMGKAPEEFPALPDIDSQKSIGLSFETLKEIINTTSFAVSRDELKPALTGVYFKFEKEGLTAVATDGHRLVRCICKDFQAKEFIGDVIIPKKFLTLLSSLSSSDENTELSLGENHLTAELGDDTIYTRVIDERFPDFESVIPTDNEKELIIDRDVITGAVRRVSIFSNKATHQVALSLDENSIQITTEDPEKASSAKEDLPNSSYKGDALVIGYNASYLKDIIMHIDDKKIIAKLKTPISATLFYPEKPRDDRDITMLLMPIRLND
ncbi:DNA polymerase III subunit beta [Candidatus Neomarinimicrobiota bacterium]